MEPVYIQIDDKHFFRQQVMKQSDKIENLSRVFSLVEDYSTVYTD